MIVRFIERVESSRLGVINKTRKNVSAHLKGMERAGQPHTLLFFEILQRFQTKKLKSTCLSGAHSKDAQRMAVLSQGEGTAGSLSNLAELQ